MDAHHHVNPTALSAKKRKPRPKLSCVPCRQKKLKCNRLLPCDSCIKHCRSHMCQYVGPMSRKETQGIQNHIQSLEARIRQLSAVDVPSLTSSPTVPPVQPTPADVQPPQHAEDQSAPQTSYPGTMLISNEQGTSYRDPTHWQAVLDEIAEVKEYLQVSEDTSPEDDAEGETAVSGPVLLFGNAISCTQADLLAALPARSVADRLVSFYLNSKEAPLVVMHIPTFAREYAAFWKNPEAASLNWLAFLYSILGASAGLHLFSTSGRADGDLAEAFDEYHRRAAHCLTMSGYTDPGRYKIEALVLNVASEILRSTDTHVGPSVLLGLASRLAMHAGYHRDPKHYPGISVFDGEMRRRVWMYLSLLDHYISLQAGLPPTTIQSSSDTDEPRNLTDDDLDPSMTTLPLARLPTEKTHILFPATLNRIMFVGAEIIGKVCSVRGVPYDEVRRLDATLRQLRATVPAPLRFQPLGDSIADAPTTIMDRYNIDLMYQKARCDLHRRYLAQHRLDPKYAYSRRECLDAARRVLQHQSDIFDASAPGGQLGYASFFFSPVVLMHFRSAAMLVSLEIACQSRHDLKQNLSSDQRQSILAERMRLSQDLARSYNIWNYVRHQSKEALKTAEALQIMLKIATTHLQHGSTPRQGESPATGNFGCFAPGHTFTPSDQDHQELLLDSHETSPLDVDLMDATFYLGQDASNQTGATPFAGSTDVVDFYDRYWDNLMLLGEGHSIRDVGLDHGNYGLSESGLPYV
ncbi:hypothetical protein P170DRAFT_433411 [Aspergillus steynii IBT 23096]|uniref:Zn(2)-C6 fungal-type domain-containing protein n=1 Tax=Aspergillus steynii IBT 23096 TaxID=1392250 RepID=A0A2I2GEU1_9EURO|nr:uncharacterized protein P170DRAFT_433411 [Aspergillus steynii IBT 23096]PLB51403.1 hypothetical protein P170DRAFT_433411 [Aspergillus steynii IBT 23096]